MESCSAYASRVNARRAPWLTAALAAVLWAVAHVVVHSARGWPMNVVGEWDLLLTALAIAAGDAPDAAIGTLHGHEAGSWLVAWLVALPLRFGVDAVTAGKWVATAFGAGSAATVAWLAARLARDTARGAWLAGGTAAVLMAAAWPGLHFELQGVNGRTPEALLFQLLAVVGAVAMGPDRRWLAGLAIGASLGVAWLLSPVALWTAVVVGVVVAWGAARDGVASSATLGAALAAGIVLPLVLFAVLVPGGGEGVRLFLHEQLGGGLGVAPTEADRLWLGVLGKVAAALEGGAHNPDLRLRPLVLAALGWGCLVAAAASLGRLRADRRDPAALAGVVALSWLAPLAVLPQGTWFYPLAYRYWVLTLALGLALGPGLLAARGRVGMVGCGLILAASLAVVPSLPRSIVAPSATRAEALVSSGAHRMNGRPGRDRHAPFNALFPHASGADQAALAEGYGLTLGGDFAIDLHDGVDTAPAWRTLDLAPDVRAAFLFGVGCGVTAVGEVHPGAVDAFAAADPADAYALWSGLRRCGGPVPPGALDGRPLRSQVSDPASLNPPRPLPP